MLNKLIENALSVYYTKILKRSIVPYFPCKVTSVWVDVRASDLPYDFVTMFSPSSSTSKLIRFAFAIWSTLNRIVADLSVPIWGATVSMRSLTSNWLPVASQICFQNSPGISPVESEVYRTNTWQCADRDASIFTRIDVVHESGDYIVHCSWESVCVPDKSLFQNERLTASNVYSVELRLFSGDDACEFDHAVLYDLPRDCIGSDLHHSSLLDWAWLWMKHLRSQREIADAEDQ